MPPNDAKIEVMDLAKSKSAPERRAKEEMKGEKIEEVARPSLNSPSKESSSTGGSRLSIRTSTIAGDDSLIALINSEFFTVHMLFQHLQKSISESKMNIVDHIINVKLSS